MKKFISVFKLAYPILIGMAVATALVLLAAQAKKDSLRFDTKKTIGILRDASVISTSFNETQKTQIKTSKNFFVVKGFPQLTFGDSIEVRMRKNLITQMKDNTGEWFEIVDQKP